MADEAEVALDAQLALQATRIDERAGLRTCDADHDPRRPGGPNVPGRSPSGDAALMPAQSC